MRNKQIGSSKREMNRTLVAFAVISLLGMAVYFRLWAIDYHNSSEDTELIRRQFDLANQEAMDESAEWRLKYDEESRKTAKCMHEFIEFKKSHDKKVEYAASMSQRFATLQKENKALLEQVEALKEELKAEKLKCNS